MKTDSTINESRDLLRRPVAGAVFLLPIAVLIVSGAVDIGNGWRTAVWAAAFSTIGAACVVNALRCGRVHCYLTGPFFLALAVVTILYGLGIAHLGASGWNSIGLAAVTGGLVLCYAPEMLLGKYRQPHQ